MVTDPATQMPTFTKGGDGPMTDWWVYEDLAKPMGKVSAVAGLPLDNLTNEPIAYSEMRPGCYDPMARLADMDLNWTERSLCFPNVARFCGQMFLEAKDHDLALKCVRAYNDWMIDDWCGPSGGRLIPLCITPLWDAQLSADEVYRNAARGCRAVTFSEMPHFLNLPSIHDPDGYWDPFFAACNETDTVINMHIGSGSRMAENSPFAPRGAHLAMTFNMAQLSMAEWLTSGLLARFPELKLAYSESQIGWMPFLLERLDNLFLEKSYAELPAVIDRPLSHYVPGRVYGCFFDDQTGVRNRESIGVTQICFETDYPHQDSTWPNSHLVVKKIQDEVSPKELEMILRTNAMDLFGLEPLTTGPAAGK